jgi:hypothetical protein
MMLGARPETRPSGYSTSIFHFSTSVGGLTAGPNADTAIDGINLLMLEIRNRVDNLRKLHDEAVQIAHRLANP